MNYFLCAATLLTFLISMITALTFANDKPCPEGERILPVTGLCESEAITFISAVSSDFADAAETFSCEVKVNEARLESGAMLYMATQCDDKLASLELRLSGMTAELFVKNSHLRNGDKPDKAGEYTASIDTPPIKYATNTAQTQMVHFSDISYSENQVNQCKARKAPIYGPNAYVIDEYSLDEQPTGDASYRHACGEYGYSADDSQYWVLGEHDAWFFNARFQDALQDFDRKSLTFISKDETGKWVAIKTPDSLMIEAMIAPQNYTIRNIADVAGAIENNYGAARGYQVLSGFVDGTFKYCVAEQTFGGATLRIGFDDSQWQIAVPYATKPDYYGSYTVDGKGHGMMGTASKDWTFWWLGQPELDQVRIGDTLIMDIRRASLEFSLKGISSAIAKVDECVHRQGKTLSSMK